jgi:hypothetical protein
MVIRERVHLMVDLGPSAMHALCGVPWTVATDTDQPVTCRTCRRMVLRWLNRQGIYDR